MQARTQEELEIALRSGAMRTGAWVNSQTHALIDRALREMLPNPSAKNATIADLLDAAIAAPAHRRAVALFVLRVMEYPKLLRDSEHDKTSVDWRVVALVEQGAPDIADELGLSNKKTDNREIRRPADFSPTLLPQAASLE